MRPHTIPNFFPFECNQRNLVYLQVVELSDSLGNLALGIPMDGLIRAHSLSSLNHTHTSRASPLFLGTPPLRSLCNYIYSDVCFPPLFPYLALNVGLSPRKMLHPSYALRSFSTSFLKIRRSSLDTMGDDKLLWDK